MPATPDIIPVVYTRRLSPEDVEDGSILITRDSWDKFPPPGTNFHIFVFGEDYRAYIQAQDSEREESTKQYRLRADAFASRIDWKAGAVVRLRKLEEASYILETQAAG